MMKIKETSFLLLEVDRSNVQYNFARCCFRFNEITIGDYNQWMVVGALLLALEDTLIRLNQQELIHCQAYEIEQYFKALMNNDDAIFKYSILPLNIEAFDGDVAIFMNIDGIECLVIQRWSDETLIVLNIDRHIYGQELQKAVNQLGN